MGGIIQFAVKGVAAGIGLASESVKAHKERKAAREAQETGSGDSDYSGRAQVFGDDIVFVTDVDGAIHQPVGVEAARDESLSREKRLSSHIPEGGVASRSTESSLEKAWMLDEEQEKLSGSRSPSPTPHGNTKDPSSLADDFLFQNPNPLADGTSLSLAGRLRLPVVLPQRRPSDRSRGFVRAYAPDLGDCGISQEMFMLFLEKFDKSTQANPMLLTLNIAAVGLEFAPIPSIYGMLAAIGVHQATVVAMELNSRSKTNSFLDKVNHSFFRPRGLYCLIMTHDPDSASSISKAVDVNNQVAGTIATSLSVYSEGRRKRLAHSLQASSGDDFGHLGSMDTAPLVYPKLEEIAVGKRARMKTVGSFVSDYKDRRAQANWANENSLSILAQGPRAQFRSRFSDPNHPASSGDLLALVTAGKLSTSSLKEKMSLSSSSINARHDVGQSFPFPQEVVMVHRGEQVPGYYDTANTGPPHWGSSQVPLVYNHENVGPAPYGGYSGNPNFMPLQYNIAPGPYGGDYQYQNAHAPRTQESRDSDDEEQKHQRKEKVGGTRGVLKSVLKKNVLYMMIVNMPSEEEMAQAQESLKKQQQTWHM